MEANSPGKLLPSIVTLYEMGILSRSRIVVIAMVGTLVVVFEGFGIALLLPLLDFIQENGDVEALKSKSSVWHTIVSAYALIGVPLSLAALCVTMFVLILLRQIMDYIFLLLRTRTRQDIGRRISSSLFRLLFESTAPHIQSMGVGSFTYLFATQTIAVTTLLNSFSKLWTLVLTFLVYAMVIVYSAPFISLLAFAVMGFAIASVSRYVRAAGTASRKLVAAGEAWTKFITSRYNGWRLIKVSDALDYEMESVGHHTDNIYRLSVGLARLRGRMELVVAPFMVFFILAGLYISVENFSVSISVITLFVVVVMRLVPVARGLAGLRQTVSTQRANLDRVMLALREAEAAREIDDGVKIFDGIFKKISLDKVTYRYPGGKIPALEGVTTDILAGRLTAIMGPSGAGKSTLIDLLPRLILPTSGNIYIDNEPIESFTLASLRRQIAFVPQDPLIFNGTVSENVRYLYRDAKQDKIENACKIAFADAFIRKLPEGYDTVLGEDGIGLSGGQRQRLALARAYLAQPSILILDEPTSALDYESEHEVQKALEILARKHGLTVVVIAHRLSTVRNADRLVVLVDGCLSESGSPKELSHSDSWFARMLSLDAGSHHESKADASQVSRQDAPK